MSLDKSTKAVRIKDALGNFVTIRQDTEGDYRFFVDSIQKGQQLADNGQIFVALVDSLNLGNGSDEKDVFILKNPAASGYVLQLKQIIVSSVKASGGTNLRYYRASTITSNGTAITERNKRDDSTTGVGEAFYSPTISARGNKLGIFGVIGGSQLSVIEDYELRIPEGSNMLITLEQPASNQTFSLNIIWAEIPV
jgi:hypothetical protein